jgi:signal transduction histidine kinase
MTKIDPLSLLHNAFPELSKEDIATLNQAADSQFFAAGTDILLEGETGTTLFIMGIGQANILVQANNQEILIDTIGPNCYFGEMAFLGETTRTATIKAQTDCHVLAIDEKDFMPIARANPNLLRNLLRQIVGHLRRNDQAVISALNVKNNDLEQAYADLAEQEKLRTKFIATLSHEIRTPLTSVRGFLGLIVQGALQGDSLRVAIDSISRNVERMVGLTNDLLLMYEMHPTSMEFSSVNLADVLIEALNDARTALNDHSVGVKLDIDPNLPQLYADRRALTLAVRALTENAFKFNPDHLPISIRAAANGHNEVIITVQDEGIGIAPADQLRIFEPFVRLEKEGGQYLFPGLGVGLTIARFVVERHNGRIEVESAPRQGSTFTIHLPQSS